MGDAVNASPLLLLALGSDMRSGVGRLGSSTLPGAMAVLRDTFASARLSSLANRPRSTERDREESSRDSMSRAFRRAAMGSSQDEEMGAGLVGVVCDSRPAAVRTRKLLFTERARMCDGGKVFPGEVVFLEGDRFAASNSSVLDCA
jgi:hypothetical protein